MSFSDRYKENAPNIVNCVSLAKDLSLPVGSAFAFIKTVKASPLSGTDMMTLGNERKEYIRYCCLDASMKLGDKAVKIFRALNTEYNENSQNKPQRPRF